MTLTALANKMQYVIKKKENAFIKKEIKCGLFSLVFVIKL